MKWISVTKELPKYGRAVLICSVSTIRVGFRDSTDNRGEHFVIIGGGCDMPDVTHWAEMPEMPGYEE